MKSVLFQAYNEYGLRVSINARGGSGNITVTGAHNEPGNCPNPAMNGIVGSAGYIINGGAHLKLSGGKGGGGQMPLFPSAGEPGSENYAYYMVIHKGKSNVTTQPLPIGYTAKGNATLSESNYVTVTAPTSTGIGDTCDFLRVDQTPGVGLRIAPHSSGGPNQIPGEGGGGKTPGVLCDPTVGTYLSFRDTSPGSNLQAYTFHTNSAYGPALDIFPGSYVLTGINYSQSTFDGACGFGSVFVVPAYSGLLTGPNITCEGPTLDDWTGNRTPYGMSFQDRIAGINPNSDLPSALMQPLWTAYAGTKSGPTKGVLNFGTQYAYAGGPTDAITIFDSDPFKTLAMPGNRPGADAADTAIGLDHGSKNGGLALRDNISISQYIGHVFDDASYLERLTSTAKMFNVPVVGLSFAGAGAATFAAGPAAGRSPGTPACAPSHVCDSVSGTINFTVGSSTKAGALLTVTTGIIRKHEPTCIGAVNLAAAPYTSLPLRITETTTTTEFNVGSAPTPFAVFELTYQCSGN
jgi:hypothetical protein